MLLDGIGPGAPVMMPPDTAVASAPVTPDPVVKGQPWAPSPQDVTVAAALRIGVAWLLDKAR